ncbi:MAG: sulfatase [Planctomycetota bacterium]|nr:sulfatase [Planctomycetota bacterium]
MTRIGPLQVLAIASGLTACGGETLAATHDPEDVIPPSVILISLDTLRAGHMSLHGYDRETTPYLERFAEECLVFDQATSVAPWTLISHATMLTGLYPEQHGVVDDNLALNPLTPLIAETLKDYGYRTYGFYRPGFLGPRHGEDRGFEVFEPHVELPEAEENMVKLLEMNVEQPFFLFLHLFDIHGDHLRSPKSLKYDPPPPYDRLFQEDAREKQVEVDYIKANAGLIQLDPPQLEAMISMYDGKIRYVDDTLERWIEGWRDAGALDNTLVIITSDHGESLGQRGGLISGHGRMWQDALHIPLIVRFPDGYRAGEHEQGLVSLVDVVPTILETVRLDADPRMPGVSLRGEHLPDRVVGAFRPPFHARLRFPWKLRGTKGDATSLHNLETDPHELDRVVNKELFFEITEDLERSFQQVLEGCAPLDAPPIPAIEMSQETRAELNALGYGGGDGE